MGSGPSHQSSCVITDTAVKLRPIALKLVESVRLFDVTTCPKTPEVVEYDKRKAKVNLSLVIDVNRLVSNPILSLQSNSRPLMNTMYAAVSFEGKRK